ncbi:MAG: hypothetical protein M3019_00845, partial [Candidatus Dormibacteraeota bacterium]|nr:hypothetical protein [Candidatus Dormibacteraeota bacterium]
MSAADVLLHLLDASRAETAGFGFPGTADVVVPLVFASVGAVVASRQRRNAVGWIFLATAFSWVLATAAQQYAIRAVLVRPGTLPGGLAAAWLGSWGFLPIVPLLGIFLPLPFPNGAAPSSRWRIFARVIGVVAVVAIVVDAIPPATLAVTSSGQLANSRVVSDHPQDLLGILAQFLQVVLLACSVAAVIGMIRRYRRSADELRQQLKWFLFAGSIVVVTLFGTAFSGSPGSPANEVASALFVVAALGLPAATGVAILKYRLYDIDVVISRTLVYGA